MKGDVFDVSMFLRYVFDVTSTSGISELCCVVVVGFHQTSQEVTQSSLWLWSSLEMTLAVASE